jgi:glycosyltransferase involved in cell wall biosynthesis
MTTSAPGPDAAAEQPVSPLLTAVVIARNDEDRIELAVSSVVEQKCPEAFEVIVVVSGSDRTADIVRERFPQVRVVEVPGVALPGRARNEGLRRARGRFISFPGSHVKLVPGSLAARMTAHQAGWAMVTGSMVNGTRSWAGWASYFVDHAAVLPARPSVQLDEAPHHCSYETSALLDAGGFPEDMRTAEDTAVNMDLFSRGYTAFRERSILLIHHSPCTTTRKLVAHHFTRGRGGGRLLLQHAVPSNARFPNPRLYALPAWFWWNGAHVLRWGSGMRGRYILALPLVWTAMAAYFCGLRYELSRAGVRVARSPVLTKGLSQAFGLKRGR